MLRRLILFCVLLGSSTLFSNPFSSFFDCIDRGDLDKSLELIKKATPKVDALPFFRTMTRGLVGAMEWHFRQDISEKKARLRAIEKINCSSLPSTEKQELIQIIEYLSIESESLLEKGKNLFSKKKKEVVPPFKMEAVQIYFGALLTQVSWVAASDFGERMMQRVLEAT